MAYEGSTDANDDEHSTFDYSDWTSGIARSEDKLWWAKYPGNPVLPVTIGGMANDGPELIIIDGITYLYVRTRGSQASHSYKLVWK